MKRVTILVTHLYGSGHLSRALTLARAFLDNGLSPQVISGGMPVHHLDRSGIDFVQLPPVRSDGSTFSRLVDSSGELAGARLFEERGRIIAEHLRAFEPDALITELFPFGRRLLRFEFEAALSAARALPRSPVILSSLRDIPAPPSKPYKADETEAWLLQYYDGVLVHSDPKVMKLEANWPVTPPVERMVRYTGFVAPPLPASDAGGSDGTGEILVTAGGGPTGRKLFEIAVETAKLNPKQRWRLLVGGGDAAEVSARLNAAANGASVIAEAARSDYRAMLARSAAAVGQCGYNTAMDWLQTGVPGVFVPFSDGGEVEQTFRAKALQGRYGYGCIAEDELTPQNLGEAVDAAIARGRVVATDLNLDGAAETARIVTGMMDARP